MNKLADHLKNDQFAEHVGIERFFCNEGYWTARLTVAETHLNGLGIAQGGVLFTLADYAFAIASNSDGRTSTGLQTTMAFVAPAKLGDTVIAHVREINRRNTISLYEIELRNEQTNQLISHFTGTGFRIM